jgi:hypothetical protein
MEHGLTNIFGETGFMLLGVAFFALMAFVLYRVAMKKDNHTPGISANNPKM